jgi:carbamate kinase
MITIRSTIGAPRSSPPILPDRASGRIVAVRIVVALGGNALLPRGGPLDFVTQQEAARVAATALEPVLGHHRVVVTHGNGPQVGLLALQSAVESDWPLDVLVAETEGMIGYVLESELDRVTTSPVISVLTRTLVAADDPAFGLPTKPIGPMYPDDDDTRQLAAERGWALHREGDGLRRVVPSPEPLALRNVDLIRSLSDDGVVVVCAGGGGIPVVIEGDLTHGVEAVVDKDLTSSLLAIGLEADLLVCLTDVDGVYEGWGSDTPRILAEVTPSALRSMAFEVGSMAPKVEAACRFVEATGRRAAIGSLADAAAIVDGSAGTSVVPQPGTSQTTS